MNTLFRIIGGAVGPVISNVFIENESYYTDPDGDGPKPVSSASSEIVIFLRQFLYTTKRVFLELGA